jgi:hypothetical protein
MSWRAVRVLWFRAALCSLVFMLVTFFVLPLAVPVRSTAAHRAAW